MLLAEAAALYTEILSKHVNKLCRKNAELLLLNFAVRVCITGLQSVKVLVTCRHSMLSVTERGLLTGLTRCAFCDIDSPTEG